MLIMSCCCRRPFSTAWWRQNSITGKLCHWFWWTCSRIRV